MMASYVPPWADLKNSLPILKHILRNWYKIVPWKGKLTIRITTFFYFSFPINAFVPSIMWSFTRGSSYPIATSGKNSLYTYWIREMFNNTINSYGCELLNKVQKLSMNIIGWLYIYTRASSPLYFEFKVRVWVKNQKIEIKFNSWIFFTSNNFWSVFNI